MSILSINLKAIRKMNHMTQYDMAKKLNVSQASVCGWENDRNEPQTKELMKVCKMFNITLDKLTGYDMTQTYKKSIESDINGCESADPETLYTVPDTAKLLLVADTTVYNLLRKGALEYTVNDNKVKIKGSVIEDFKHSDSYLNSKYLADYLAKHRDDKGTERVVVNESADFEATAKEVEPVVKEIEMVDHPSHYNTGKYETIEKMRVVFGDEAVATFCKLNAFKYMDRAGNKQGEAADKDHSKAEWYIAYADKLQNNILKGGE